MCWYCRVKFYHMHMHRYTCLHTALPPDNPSVQPLAENPTLTAVSVLSPSFTHVVRLDWTAYSNISPGLINFRPPLILGFYWRPGLY